MIIITFTFFLLWLLLSVALSVVMAVYIQVAWLCPQADNPTARISLGNTNFDWCSDFDMGSGEGMCVLEDVFISPNLPLWLYIVSEDN